MKNKQLDLCKSFIDLLLWEFESKRLSEIGNGEIEWNTDLQAIIDKWINEWYKYDEKISDELFKLWEPLAKKHSVVRHRLKKEWWWLWFAYAPKNLSRNPLSDD